MIIRQARSSDLEQVFDIYMQGYDEAAEDPYFGDINRLKRPERTVLPAWSKRLCAEMSDGHLLFLVAVDGAKVAGFCFAKKKDIPDSELSHVGIVGMRVIKERRGQGLGRQLMRELIKRSRRRFEVLELSVMPTNKAAKRLYLTSGFRKWGTEPMAIKRRGRYMAHEHMYLKL